MSVHGYQPYKPKDFTQKVLRAAKAVLVEYETWENPMTVRQVFYRLVAEYNYAKTEKAYQSLIGYIARSRRAYQDRVLQYWSEHIGSYQDCHDEALSDPLLIPFGWVRDERGHTVTVTSYEDVPDFVKAVENAVEQLQMDRMHGQDQHLEVWCEAGGMVPLMSEIARPYGVRVSSGGGYDSVTAKHKLAMRVEHRMREEETYTLVLHVGDFDPSGEGMFNTLQDDVSEMARQLCEDDGWVDFKRVALTEDQVIEMEVETAPPKPLDSRLRGFIADHPTIRRHLGTNDITAQLEALTPPVLRQMLTEAIEAELNAGVLAEVEEQEESLRGEIRKRLELGD